jgi:hypothetical protein
MSLLPVDPSSSSLSLWETTERLESINMRFLRGEEVVPVGRAASLVMSEAAVTRARKFVFTVAIEVILLFMKEKRVTEQRAR